MISISPSPPQPVRPNGLPQQTDYFTPSLTDSSSPVDRPIQQPYADPWGAQLGVTSPSTLSDVTPLARPGLGCQQGTIHPVKGNPDRTIDHFRFQHHGQRQTSEDSQGSHYGFGCESPQDGTRSTNSSGYLVSSRSYEPYKLNPSHCYDPTGLASRAQHCANPSSGDGRSGASASAPEATRLINQELYRLTTNSNVWLDDSDKLCAGSSTCLTVSDTSVKPSEHQEPKDQSALQLTPLEAFSGRLGTIEFLRIASKMAKIIHQLTRRGVYLRITCKEHWKLAGQSLNPHLTLHSFTTNLGSNSSTVNEEDLLSVYNQNIAPELIKPNFYTITSPTATEVYTLTSLLYQILIDRSCMEEESKEVPSLSTTPNSIKEIRSDDLGKEYKPNAEREGKLLSYLHHTITTIPLAPSQFRDVTPKELDHIILKGLSKEPTRRYLDCFSLSKDLDKLKEVLEAEKSSKNTQNMEEHSSGPVHLNPDVVDNVEINESASPKSFPRVKAGALDTLARLELSNKLYGAERYSRNLESILHNVIESSRSSYSVIRGQSGAGKTKLVTEILIPIISRRGGLWIRKKFHRQTNQGASVLKDLLNSLLRPLLLISPELDDTDETAGQNWNDQILSALGDVSLDLLRIYMDEDLKAAFKLQGRKSQLNLEPPNPLIQSAINAAMVKLIKLIAKKLSPLVIFLDDVQWMPGPDYPLIQHILEIIPDIENCLLVFAIRSQDTESSSEDFVGSSLCQTLLACPLLIDVEPLKPDHIFQWLSDVLGPHDNDRNPILAEQRRAELDNLTDFIGSASKMNPMYCRQIITSMKEQSILIFDWDLEQWRFNVELAALSSATRENDHKFRQRIVKQGYQQKVVEIDSIDFIKSNVLMDLSQRLRDIIVHASCIAGHGTFSLKMLAIALDENVPNSGFGSNDPLFTDVVQLVFKNIFVSGGSHIEQYSYSVDQTPQPNILYPSYSSEVRIDQKKLQFVHDQWNDASYGLLKEKHRAKFHFDIAQRFYKFASSGEELMVYLRIVAGNLKLAHEYGLPLPARKRKMFVDSLLDLSKWEEKEMKPKSVIQNLELALKLVTEKDWIKDFDNMTELYHLLGNGYYANGDLQKSLEIFSLLELKSTCPLRHIKVMRSKIRVLLLLNPQEGTKLSTQVIEAYFNISLDDEFQSMSRLQVFKQPCQVTSLPETPSDIEMEYQALLGEIIPTVYSTSADVGKTIMWLCYQFARKVGGSSHVAYSLGGVAVFCCEENNFDAAKKYLKLAETMTDPDKTTPYQRIGSEFSRGASGHFLCNSWAIAAQEYLQVAERASILANFEVATYSLAHALAIGFWGSAQLQPQIDVGVQIVTQARKQSPIGSVFASVALTAMENLVHCSDEDNDPTQLIGHLLDPGAYETSKELHMHDLQWTSFHMILDLLFERPIWPIFNDRRARDASSGVLAQNITCQFLVFCAICEGIRNGEKVGPEDYTTLDSILVSFSVWSRDSEAVEFKVMKTFLKAMRLSTTYESKDLGEIINAFDETIDLASEHKLFLLEGLACEMLCNYIEKFRVRASRLAYGYRLSAYRAYQSWGALKKCQDMRRKHKFRLPRHSEYSPVSLCVTSDRNIPTIPKATSPDPRERSEKPIVSNSTSPHLALPVIPDTPIGSTTTEQSTGNSSHPSNTSQRMFDSAETTKQNFDVAALLAASHTWQTSSANLSANLIRFLLQISGAVYGCIALVVNSKLRLKAAGTAKDLQSDLDLDLVLDEKAHHLAPTSILRYVATTGNTATRDLLSITSLKDPFLKSRKPNSIFGHPILYQGTLAGVLYLESPNHSAFSHADQSIIACLSTQTVISLEKTMAAQVLEEKVNERTIELSTRNQELAVAMRELSTRNAELDVAMRELSTRNEELAVAMQVAEDARQSEARFLMNMSHELRTPTNSITCLSELLQEAPSISGLFREYLTQIKSSSNDLLKIIQDVLDWSKLSSQLVITEKIPFNLRDCIETAIISVGELATSKGLECWYTTPLDEDPITWIIGDEFKCKQIIINYLSNALRFTSPPGFVAITSSHRIIDPEGEESRPRILIEISVTDNGIGIAKEKQHTLFKSFSQVDESTTRLFGGSGLGLAISRSLAQLLGGDAWVQSDSGKGSIFSFSFQAHVGDSIAPMKLNLPPDIPPRSKECLVYAPPLIAKDVLNKNINHLGLQSRILKDLEELDSCISDGYCGLLVIDPLLLSSKDGEYIDSLIERKGIAGIVKIGSSQVGHSRVPSSGDRSGIISNRLVLRTRPIKTQSLVESVGSILCQTQAKSSVKKAPHLIKVLPVLQKDFPLSILAVDDNQVNRLVFKRVLERLGYMDTDLAFDGKAAVERCQTRKYDLCLMDSEMPIKDGTSAMREIRKLNGSEAPYIAVVTAAAMPGDREMFMSRGFDAYLSKPVILPELVEVIKCAYNLKYPQTHPPNLDLSPRSDL